MDSYASVHDSKKWFSLVARPEEEEKGLGFISVVRMALVIPEVTVI